MIMMDEDFHWFIQAISQWVWTSSWIAWCWVGSKPLERERQNLHPESSWEFSACWISLWYWCSVSTSTLPIPQAESNAVAVAHGAELGCYCRSWELMMPSYDLRCCKTCCGCWGMPAGYEHFRTHTFEELRQRSLPQKLGYLLILGGWLEFLLFSLVFAFQYLCFWSKATWLLVGVE